MFEDVHFEQSKLQTARQWVHGNHMRIRGLGGPLLSTVTFGLRSIPSKNTLESRSI